MRWYLLLATVESWVVPSTIASVGDALAVTSSEFAIASNDQVGLLAEGDVAPLLGLVVVEGEAFLVSTALVEAIEGCGVVSEARISGDIKVAEPVVKGGTRGHTLLITSVRGMTLTKRGAD